MRKYKAYEVTSRQDVDAGYHTHWRIRDTDTSYYHHRVGGPAYVRYSPGGTVVYVTWDLEGREYASEAEYWEALEEWLG